MNNFSLTTIQGKNVVLDISRLFSDEVLYINATKLASQFNKRVDNFLRLEDTKEYLRVLTTSDVRELEMIKTQEGKYGGTYFHSDLIVYYLRWLSIEFAVQCDKYIKNTIQTIQNDKIYAKATVEANKKNQLWSRERATAKDVRISLQEKIREFCRFAEEQRGSRYTQCPYYKIITDAIYDFLELKKPPNNVEPRDYFSGAEIEDIKNAEKKIENLLNEIIANNGPRSDMKAQIFKYLAQNEVGNIA